MPSQKKHRFLVLAPPKRWRAPSVSSQMIRPPSSQDKRFPWTAALFCKTKTSFTLVFLLILFGDVPFVGPRKVPRINVGVTSIPQRAFSVFSRRDPLFRAKTRNKIACSGKTRLCRDISNALFRRKEHFFCFADADRSQII